jgi:hypothetical protein
MKITFADSFYESLDRLVRHDTWWYKTYQFFKRDLWMFFRNIWRFRKELYRFRTWDHQFNQNIFARSLELTANAIVKHGSEVYESRLPKVAKMRRAAELLRDRSDFIFEQVEKELGPIMNESWWERDDTLEEYEHNRKFFARVTEIEEQEWEELWTILKGTGKPDGTDLRRWWD